MAAEDPAQELMVAISDFSEAAFCAGWMDAVAFFAWRAALGERFGYGNLEVADYGKRLMELARAAGGWWYWSDEQVDATGPNGEPIKTDRGEVFAPLAEWQPMYDRWSRASVR